MAAARILIVDDEADISHLVAYNLRRAGYEALEARDGPEALRLIGKQRPDLVILDRMLPSGDGGELCAQLKRNPATRDLPIILLTAKSAEWDRVQGFELGADDYVVKPFSLQELVLRVRAVLRRQAPSEVSSEVLTCGALRVERQSRRVFVAEREVSLTRIEFELLCHFLQRPGRALSREALLEAVWGYDATSLSRTVDTHVKRLREKLGPAAAPLETVRGTGYRWQEAGGAKARP